MTWLLVGVIGLVAGVVSGLFGVGGAIVIIPGLLPVALLGALEYHRRGQVNVPYAAIIAAGLFVGALIGAKLAGMLSDEALRRAFGVFLMIVAVRLLVR